MNCREVEERDVLDGYVRGTLAEEERDAFEQHYLGCARCAAEVETALAMREVLQKTAPRRSPVPLWAAAAAAIVLVAILAIWWSARGREAGPQVVETPPAAVSPGGAPVLTPAEETILELAQVAPPAYEETVLRSVGGAAFRDAMRFYAEGRYAEAIPALKEAAAQNPSASEVRFFLGASQLLAGDAEQAIDTLRTVVDDSASPFSVEARFYLAKALIRARRLEEARAELDKLRSGGGPWGEDSKELLQRLP